MTYRPILALVLPALALSACGENTATPESPAPAPAPVASASATPSSSAADLPGEESREITLTSASIILVNAVEGRGAATTLAFGMQRERALAAMEVAFGKPDLTSNPECGAGPMEFARFGGLQLNFLDGKLAGWLARPADNLVTSDGIRPGLPLAELKAERPVEMADSTLEGEFSYQSPDGSMIGGFEGGNGTIASLHAGVNCFFR